MSNILIRSFLHASVIDKMVVTVLDGSAFCMNSDFFFFFFYTARLVVVPKAG